ncbi:MAG: MFS transporter [Actinobacteria bacterium]|nr:MFS transporter [Actinomycetota bacterium]
MSGRPGVRGAQEEPFQTGRVATVAAGHAVHDTFTAFLPTLLPKFIEQMSLSNTAAGALSSFLRLPGLLQWAIGHLADRTTLRWLVVLAPGVTSVLMASLGWAPTYGVLAVMLLCTGVSVAAFHAVAPVAIGRLSGSRLGKGMGFWMVGGETGRTLGPIVVGTALAYLSLRQLAFFAIAGVLTSVTLHVRLRDVPLRAPAGAAPVPWRTAIRRMRRLMAVLTAMMALRSLMQNAVTVFLPVYLTDEGTSLWLAAAALSIVEGAGVVGAFGGGWLSDHVGRRRMLLVSHLAAPAALFWFLAADGWLRILILPLVGLTLLSITPVLMAIVQEEFPESRALANGTYLSLNFAIQSVSAVAFGAFGDAFGLTTAIVVGGFAMLAATPLIWLLPRRRPTAA